MASRNGLSHLSLTDLEKVIRARRTQLGRLEKRRATLLRRVDALDAQISAMGGSGAGRGRRGRLGTRGAARPQNEQSLPEAIHDVLAKAKAPVRVGDVADRVRAGGYRSSSANFRSIVNQALIKDARFASAGRGLYQLKRAAAGKKPRAAASPTN